MLTKMYFWIIILMILFFVKCSINKHRVNSYRQIQDFDFFTTSDTLNITIKYFIKNDAYCFTEALPYALIIGEVSPPNKDSMPKIISVLDYCDNNNYDLGQKLKVVGIIAPTTKTTLTPIWLVKDTFINKIKWHAKVGAEYPAIWGRVIN